MSEQEKHEWALYNVEHHPSARMFPVRLVFEVLAAVIFLLVLLVTHAHGQTITPTTVRVTNPSSSPVNVTCISGCAAGGGTSSNFGSSFPSSGTAIGVKNGANMVNLAADGSSNLLVNCAAGCAGGSSTPSDAFANPTTAGLNLGFSMVWNGASWDRQYGDKTNGAFVNVKVLPAVTQGTSPWVVSLGNWAGTVLGTPTNFGTTPGAVIAGSANSSLFLGTTAARTNQTTTAAGALDVNIVGALGVTNSATNGIFSLLTDNTTAVGVIAGTTALKTDLSSVAGTATVTAAAGVQKVGIVGNANAALDAANNAAMPTNSISVSSASVAIGTQPTAVTGGNGVRPISSTEGVLYVQQGNSNRFSCFVQAVTAITQCQAAPGAGLRAYVTGVDISAQSATVNTWDVVFGTGSNCGTGTTALTHKFQGGTSTLTTNPVNITATFLTPLIPTAANAICIRPSGAVAYGATVTGFIAP